MTEAFELWRAWSSNASANGRCLSCRVRKSGESFFDLEKVLLTYRQRRRKRVRCIFEGEYG